jgi:cobalt transporter subunit CbtA
VLRRILLIALIAGAAGGLVASALQITRLTPLILAAETYETAVPAEHTHGAHTQGDGAHPHSGPEWKPSEGGERLAFTVLFNLLAGFGFALLLNAGLTLRRAAGHGPTIVTGAAWGLAGFASFALAPALGLPPELPGMPAADLLPRQIWWIGTAGATAVGIGLLAAAAGTGARRGRMSGLVGAALGVALIAAPHVIGAPQAAAEASAVPASLAVRFAVSSLATAALFWLVLGGLSGWLQRRLG